jgi:hypothetical protein
MTLAPPTEAYDGSCNGSALGRAPGPTHNASAPGSRHSLQQSGAQGHFGFRFYRSRKFPSSKNVCFQKDKFYFSDGASLGQGTFLVGRSPR